jgi:phage N-6-adenine-methyltransferase
VFDAIDNEFNFGLDAAASNDNHKCETYMTKDQNALMMDWSFNSKSVWINPPYGRGMIKPFMQKAIEQKAKGVTSVLLVPATMEAKWLPINQVSEIRIITGGRLSFYHPTTKKIVAGNTKGSMLVIFRPSSMPCFLRMVDRDELLGVKP